MNDGHCEYCPQNNCAGYEGVVEERDEARAEVLRLIDGMELAWGIIANAGGGDWDREGAVWKVAAERWRDEHWHAALTRAKDGVQHG